MKRSNTIILFILKKYAFSIRAMLYLLKIIGILCLCTGELCSNLSIGTLQRLKCTCSNPVITYDINLSYFIFVLFELECFVSY